MTFAPIPDILAALARGEMIILVDDEDRENEGDLVMAAEFADAKSIAFMATRGCGLICLAMDGAMLDRLGLPLMASVNASRFGTAFTLSIEAREGVTTGISAADRARTIQVAIGAESRPQDIVSPGHVFPLRARDGGVLVRAGQTEGSVDLARMAGLKPAGVICEIMKPDGTMARLADLEAFAREHKLLLASIADVIAWREARESLVALVAEATLATAHGDFRAYAYRNVMNGEHHLALVRGERLGPGRDLADPVLVRVQRDSALTGRLAPVPGAVDPDACLRQIADAGEGVFLAVHDPEGRGLADALVALGGRDHRELTARALSTAMDPRDYGIGAQILHHLGVRRMRLITGSDRHISALSGHDLEVVERVRPEG
ncbi:MAG TPA: 3,4-dihydroxy-2-butanone-4-phosphate synthase [Planctomycetota bacterium]|nr:3,4-dihydroxy-2-butanone-4-phosphate synthase [Planctomycetota bacterium]